MLSFPPSKSSLTHHKQRSRGSSFLKHVTFTCRGFFRPGTEIFIPSLSLSSHARTHIRPHIWNFSLSPRRRHFPNSSGFRRAKKRRRGGILFVENCDAKLHIRTRDEGKRRRQIIAARREIQTELNLGVLMSSPSHTHREARLLGVAVFE